MTRRYKLSDFHDTWSDWAHDEEDTRLSVLYVGDFMEVYRAIHTMDHEALISLEARLEVPQNELPRLAADFSVPEIIRELAKISLLYEGFYGYH